MPALALRPITDRDCVDHAGLEWLDHLGPAAWDDFAVRRRDDVYLADACPSQRAREQHNNGQADRAPERRCRRFDDLKRGRKECELFLLQAVAGAWEWDDPLISWLH